MLKTGDRVSRDSVFQLATLERLGNVTYVDKSARVAHVVFDNHSDTMPIPCTFESLRLVEPPKGDAAHEDYKTLEHFQSLKDAEKGIGVYNVGESVALLLSDSKTCRVVYGKVYGTAYNPHTGIKYHVIERNGSKHVGNDNTAVVRI